MADNKDKKSGWLTTAIPALFGALIGGIGTTVLNEAYFQPQHFRTEVRAQLYRETYERRVASYETLLQLFSDVSWLERQLGAEPNLDKRDRLRFELIQRVQRQLTTLPVIANVHVYEAAFKALDYYVKNARNFTPEVRRKWITEYYSPLVKAMRDDLYQDEIREELAKQVFPESLDKFGVPRSH